MYLVISTFGTFIVKTFVPLLQFLSCPIRLFIFTSAKFERVYRCGPLPVLLVHYLSLFRRPNLFLPSK